MAKTVKYMKEKLETREQICPKCGNNKLFLVERGEQRDLDKDSVKCVPCSWENNIPVVYNCECWKCKEEFNYLRFKNRKT